MTDSFESLTSLSFFSPLPVVEKKEAVVEEQKPVTSFFRPYEVDYISRVFEKYEQEGDFEVKLGANQDLFVKFYSKKNMCDIVLAPDWVKEVERNGAMIIKEKEGLEVSRGCTGAGYRKRLESYGGPS